MTIKLKQFGILLSIISVMFLTVAASQQSQPVLISKWERVGNGIEDAKVTSLLFDKNGTLYAGLSDYGSASVFALPKNAKNWKPFADGLPNQKDVLLMNDKESVLVYSDANDNFYCVDKSGLMWSSCYEMNDRQSFIFQKTNRIFVSNNSEFVPSFFAIGLTESNDIKYDAVNDTYVGATGVTFVAQDKNNNVYFNGNNQDSPNTFAKTGYFYLKTVNFEAKSRKVLGEQVFGRLWDYEQDSVGNHYIVSQEIPRDSSGKTDSKGVKFSVQKLSPTRAAWQNISSNLNVKGYESSILIDPANNIFIFSTVAGIQVLPVGITTWLNVSTAGLPADGKKVNSAIFGADKAIYIATDAGIYKGTR